MDPEELDPQDLDALTHMEGKRRGLAAAAGCRGGAEVSLLRWIRGGAAF